MKKIGILTLHKSHNCGSIMQAYALQEVLKIKNLEPELIDFGTTKQMEEYSIYTKQKDIKGLIKNIIFYINKKTLIRHWEDYNKFRNENLNLSSNKFDEKSKWKLVTEEYDAFICGSDQIWNVTIPDYDEIYFLPFYSKVKMAYAASFGARDPRDFENYEKIKNWLLDFDYISIRENSGKKIISELTGREVDVVLDPTLLLNNEYYNKILRDSKIKGKYIFYYATLHSKEMDDFVKKISEKYNLKVIVWNSKEYYKKMVWRYGFKMSYNQDPGIYLDLIKNAFLVITTSFHGTIFSTIYKKNFWTLKNGDMFKTDDRVKTMMVNLGIEDRMIIPNFDNDFDYLINANYNNYEKNLPKLQKKSHEFIDKILK